MIGPLAVLAVRPVLLHDAVPLATLPVPELLPGDLVINGAID